MKKNIYKFFQFLVIIICLGLIVKIISEEKKFLEIFFNLNFYKIFPALFLSIFISLCFSQLIFKILLSTTKIKISPRRWLYIFFNSQFLDTIPFAGFFYKAVRLKKFNLNYSNFLFSYLFIFVCWIILYSFFFFLDISLYSFVNDNFDYFIYGFIFLMLCIFSYFFISILNRFINKFNFKKFIFIQFKELINFIELNIFKIKNIKIFFTYGFFIHILEFFLYFVIIKFLDLDISLEAIFLIFLINSIIDFFPITPKNIGFSEFMSGLLLNLIGFNFTTGVLIKVFIRISSLISTTILFFINNLYVSK